MTKKVRIQFALALVFLFGISTGLKAQPGNLPTPYCMPLYVQSPCNQPGPSNMPGNFLNDFIHSVLTFSGNVDINNPNTGCNAQVFPSIGLKNYIYHKCQHNLSVSAGQVVSFSVQIGQINAQGVAAFIDWNNDNIFSAAPEKIGWSTGTVPAGGWLTFTTTIPPAQPNGTYRLRIRCAMGINGSTIDPCSSYSSGEVEDYDVYVGTTSPIISNVVASSNSTLCSGNTLSLNLTYTSQCSPSYTWVGPNNFVSNSQNPTISNAQPLHSGNYSLTVTCGTACPVSLTTSVTIYQAPTTAVAGPSICTCLSAPQLNGNVPSVGTGFWSLLSGTASINSPAIPNTLLSGLAWGNHVFQWTITNGNCISTSTTLVQGTPFPTASNAGPSQTVCGASSVTMAANAPASGIGTWILVSGSGIFASPNSPSSIVTGVGTGTNIYQWQIANTCGSCVNNSTLAVINNTSIAVSIVANPTAVCTNYSSTLTASGANSYTWTGSTYTGSIVQPTIAMPSGTYVVTGLFGTCSNTASIVVYTMSPPILTVSASAYTFCPQGHIQLFASGANTYNWGPCVGGFLSICIGSSVWCSPLSTIIYTVTGYVPGCSSSATIQLTAIPKPTVTAVSSSSLICAGDQVTLTASGALNYTWVPALNATSIIVSPTITTTYTVIGTATTACNGTSTITQNVSPCTSLYVDETNLQQIKIFPNPFKDELKIVSIRNIQIKLLDVTGKEILRREVDGEISINTSQFAKGVYFIHFTSDKGINPVKVIKD